MIMEVKLKEPWDMRKHDAVSYISEKIEEMQKLFQNVILMADYHDIRVMHRLEWPEDMRLGHNENMGAEVYWNPSSRNC